MKIDQLFCTNSPDTVKGWSSEQGCKLVSGAKLTNKMRALIVSCVHYNVSEKISCHHCLTMLELKNITT